jgi:hypothetical protein
MRASGVYQEETASALLELDGIPGAEELARDEAFHSLVIPDGHGWEDVRSRKEADLGEALNDALRSEVQERAPTALQRAGSVSV